MNRVCILSLSFVLGAMIGCHHAPRAIEGSSAFTFVEPPPPPTPLKPKRESSEEARRQIEALLVAAPIQPLAKPVYPPAALGRERMPVFVGVRITVDAEGRVADIRASPVVLSTPTPRADEFRAAVEDALRQWRFRPAELRKLAPVVDAPGAPAWALVSREKTDYVFDVSFFFQSTGEVVARGLK